MNEPNEPKQDTTPTPDPAPEPGIPITAEPAGPPPAAAAVANGDQTEREFILERQNRELQTRLSELEDENRTLKTPAARPSRPEAPEKRHWLAGATFFEEEK